MAKDRETLACTIFVWENVRKAEMQTIGIIVRNVINTNPEQELGILIRRKRN